MAAETVKMIRNGKKNVKNDIIRTMKIIEKGSRFTVSSHFTLSQTDDEVLSLLYLPLIAGSGYALYRYLFSLSFLSARKAFFYFEEMEGMLGMETSSTMEALSRLEAIGLVSTYRKEDIDRTTTYLFRLYPPASPRKFFADVILKSLLEQKIGEKKMQEMTFLFVQNDETPAGYTDVTSRLGDVYSVSTLSDKTEQSIEDKNYRNVSSFDRKRLLKNLKEAGIAKNVTSSLDEIVDLAILYFLGEGEAAELVEKNIDSSGRFHLDTFRADVRSFRQYRPLNQDSREETYQNRLLQLFSTLSPQKYLSYRLNANPPQYMLEEIEKISSETHLPNAVINVVLDYSLKKTDGKFVSLYIDKVAFSLLGNDIQTPYDAMVYLNSQDVSKKKAKNTARRKKAAIKTIEQPDESIDEEKMQELERKYHL